MLGQIDDLLVDLKSCVDFKHLNMTKLDKTLVAFSQVLFDPLKRLGDETQVG